MATTQVATPGSVVLKDNQWSNKSSMENLIEQSISNNSRCFTCGGLVYAVERKRTTNHVYHNRCFRCRICKRSLTESSLNEEGDEIYCANCYRKKQRGDCNDVAFQRAAAEKAQYVYDAHHPNVPKLVEPPRLPNKPDFSRQPSLTLRKLERIFLSHQDPILHGREKSNESTQKTQPSTIKTFFSAPSKITVIPVEFVPRKDELSSLHFSPATSLSPRYGPGLITTAAAAAPPPPPAPKVVPEDRQTKPNYGHSQSILFNSDLFKTTPSPTKRRFSIIPELNEDTEKKDQKPSIFKFPSVTKPVNRGRSRSMNYTFNRYKTK